MAGSVTVTLTDVCTGGNHLTFQITGAKELLLVLELGPLVNEPLTEEEAAAFIKCLVKLGKIGRNNVQVRNLFQAGVTVTI